jgi:hypothetical protein
MLRPWILTCFTACKVGSLRAPRSEAHRGFSFRYRPTCKAQRAYELISVLVFHDEVISGASEMRRPLAAELSAEERSLARRWALTSGLLYSTIAILAIGALLVISKADRVAVAAKFEPQDLLRERSPMRPYGSLPDTAWSTAACNASQFCKGLTPDGAGSAK